MTEWLSVNLDQKNKLLIEAKNEFENYLYNTKNSISTKNDGAPENFDEIKAEIEPIVDEGLKWFEDNSNAKLTVDDYKNKQKEYEDKIRPLITKLYGAVPPMGAGPETSHSFNPFANQSPEGGNGTKPDIDEVD